MKITETYFATCKYNDVILTLDPIDISYSLHKRKGERKHQKVLRKASLGPLTVTSQSKVPPIQR